ncbi:MAG: hypothetical protein IKS83_08670 [Victivallales bacterium]|nr:hypothetical protein [Victivallales bacterium]
MPEEPHIGFVERLKRRVDNSPVPAARSAAVLTQLLFGVSALAIVAFSCWCLGWLRMDAAANALCLAGILVTAFYGFSVVRYYRGLHMPKVEGAFKWGSAIVWLGLGWIAAQCMMRKGMLLTPMALLTLLYIFFAFLGVLISRQEPRQLGLLAASTTAGLLGWGLAGAALICCLLRYCKVMFHSLQTLEQFPLWYQATLVFLDRQVGVPAMLLSGGLLILTDWGLRLKVFSLRGGETIRSFFTWQAWLSIACFLGAVVFSHAALGTVAKRAASAQSRYETRFPQDTEDFERQRQHAFAVLQEEFGRKLAAATQGDANPATRSPFMWKRETARRWIPAVNSPEENAQLADYIAKVQPMLDDLPAMLEERPQVPMFSPGLLLILHWRMEAAVQQHDAKTACECLDLVSRMVREQLAAPSVDVLLEAVGRLDEVAQMAERLMEQFPAEKSVAEGVMAQLMACREALVQPRGTMLREILASATRRRALLAADDTAAFGASFWRMAWIFPEPRMLVEAEYATLVRSIMAADSLEDLAISTKMDGPQVRYLNELLVGQKSVRRVLLLAQSRLNAEILLAGIQIHRIGHEGRIPMALPQLVPECFSSLPDDPLAPKSPYAIAQETVTVDAWNFQTQRTEQHTSPALVVRSTADVSISAKILLGE